MDGGAWKAAVHGVAKSRTRLSDFTFTFLFHALEKEMATHSSVLTWRIPWAEEPGRLQSMESQRVGHDWAHTQRNNPNFIETVMDFFLFWSWITFGSYDWATSLSLFSFMHWRRKWQPTPVFLPGESEGLWSLMGCRLWGRTESDTTEAT